MEKQQLIDMRANVVAQLRALNERAKAPEGLSAEDSAQFDKLFDEQEKLQKRIENLEKMEALEKTQASAAIQTGTVIPENKKEDLVMKGFLNYLAYGPAAGREGYNEFMALQADKDTSGGYLKAPEQFVTGLIKSVDNETFIRPRATTFQLTGTDGMGAVSLDADPSAAVWGTEIGTITENTGMSFGKRELRPKPLTTLVKISNKLLRTSGLDIANLVMERLSYVYGINQEQAFLTGSGANEPLGLFTASAQGISTGRDVSTGNGQTAIAFAGLYEAKYSLKAQYQRVAEWLFSRDAIKQIVKLVDGDGQYLWQPSVQQGQPDMLLGRPVLMSEYVPNTFTSGNYVGMFADFSKYWIADSLNMQVQRLVELFALTRQEGFISVAETDGMPVLEEAFARVKLA